MSHKNSVILFTIGAILTCLTFFSACRLKVPTPEEQAELIKRKSFPNGAPSWFVGAANSSEGGISAQQGSLMPDRLVVPQAVEMQAGEVAYPTLVRQEELKRESSENGVTTSTSTANRRCPGLEDEIAKLKTSSDSKFRVEIAKGLINKCPANSEFHIWLAEDYLKIGTLDDAGAAFRKALDLDPGNMAAQDGLSRVDKLRSR